jgi:hypothetical protein
MSKLTLPESDFYEIIQNRIDMLNATGRKVYGDHINSVITELKSLQQNYNSYLYKIKHNKQAD